METGLLIALIVVASFAAMGTVIMLRAIFKLHGALDRAEERMDSLHKEMVAQEQRLNEVIIELENKPTDPISALLGMVTKYGMRGWTGAAGNIGIKLTQSFLSNRKKRKRKALPAPADVTQQTRN